MWTQSYSDLLLEWAALREQASDLPLEEALTLIHDWWNTAPIVNNTVHFNDKKNWPLPWDLLAQPAYCDVAKCLGIAYTLILIDCDEIQSMNLLHTENNTYVQIKTNDAEYMLSNETGTINSELDGNLLSQVNCENLMKKIR